MIIEEGHVAFITGGASGIGLAIGKALAAKGVKVVLADIDTEALDRVRAEFSSPVKTIGLDVRDRDQWAAARAHTEAHFGPVDILVNNAGIMNEGRANYKEYNLFTQTPESFDRMIGINLVGVYNGVHTFGSAMAARGCGHIINTSSTQGVVACGGIAAYAAAKFGVVGMTEALRQEIADHGVGVSVLCPGIVQTNLGSTTKRLAGLPPVEMPAGFGIAPEGVAQQVLAAIEANELYIFTHGEYIMPLAKRYADMVAAIENVPISSIYQPNKPLPGTPEFADIMANMPRA